MVMGTDTDRIKEGELAELQEEQALHVETPGLFSSVSVFISGEYNWWC